MWARKMIEELQGKKETKNLVLPMLVAQYFLAFTVNLKYPDLNIYFKVKKFNSLGDPLILKSTAHPTTWNPHFQKYLTNMALRTKMLP